jgi:flagellar assembly protein FliH
LQAEKVEIHLSNIIKPEHENDLLSVTTFDFAEIIQTRTAEGSNIICKGTGKKHCPPSRDARLEAEAAIQSRLLEAERKAQQLEKETYEKAYAQGQKDGFEYGRKHISIIKEHLERLLDGLEKLPDRLLGDYREWIINTCLTIARQIVRRELQTDPRQLIELIDTLLRETSEKYTVSVQVNPADLDLMKKHTDLSHLSEQNGRKLEFSSDPDIERGGCRLESEIELVDATIEKQFALIEQDLRSHGPEPDVASSV